MIIEATTFQRWRSNGVEVIAPTYVRTFLAVMGGAHTVREVARATGMAETTTGGHLRRLKGWGLVDWSYSRAGTIHAIVSVVDVPLLTSTILDCFELGEWAEPVPDTAVTNVLDLRKDDLLTHEGVTYVVKEVRRGNKRPYATVRMQEPGQRDIWVKFLLTAVLDGQRTPESVRRMAVAKGTPVVSTRSMLV